jgi:hypothetical protein
MADEKQTAGIGKGTPGPGRPKGIPNKATTLLKDAILLAAEAEGEDGMGANGLTGYCRMLAREEKKAFATLMGRVLPTQLEGIGGNGEIIFKTVYETPTPKNG